jgi:hypothetical protein
MLQQGEGGRAVTQRGRRGMGMHKVSHMQVNIDYLLKQAAIVLVGSTGSH